MSATPVRPIYLHPLAYLVALQGAALMRACAGEHDAAFVHERLAAVRRMLEEGTPFGGPDDPGVLVPPMSYVDGYEEWARRYDSADNGYFDIEAAAVDPLLAALPVGVAVDVCCGSGRKTETLAGLGHEVRGYDGSPHMLALARAKLPDVTFAEAALDDLPEADAGVDLVTCFIALTHHEDLGAAFAEFARILRPGGHLVVSDSRTHWLGSPRNPLPDLSPRGGWAYIPGWEHSAAAYLRASLDAGFVVRDHQELFYPRAMPDAEELAHAPSVPDDLDDPTAPVEIWDLHTWDPMATWAAKKDHPSMVMWHFQKAGGGH